MSDNKRTLKVLEEIGFKADSNETFSLERSLSAVQAVPYDTVFNMNRGMELVPINASIQLPEGAADYKYNIMNPAGEAKFIANGALDFPDADAYLEEETVKILDFGQSYFFTHQDLQRAQMNGFQLDSARARVAAMAMNNKKDSILAIGDVNRGVYGLANNPNVSISQAAAAAGGGFAPAWDAADKTSAEILTDMLNLIKNTNGDRDIGMWEVDTLVLPPSHFEIVASRFLSVDNTETVLSAFRRIRPEVNVVKWSRLADASATGGQRAIAYKKDPAVLEAFMPVSLDQRGPQERALNFHVYLFARLSGVAIRYPFAVRYLDAI